MYLRFISSNELEDVLYKQNDFEHCCLVEESVMSICRVKKCRIKVDCLVPFLFVIQTFAAFTVKSVELFVLWIQKFFNDSIRYLLHISPPE